MTPLQRLRRDDTGFSLVEVLVSIVLASIVGSIVTSVMITSTKTARWQEAETRALGQAKVAMERMTRDVRGANSLTATTPRKISLVETHAGVRSFTTLEVVTDGETSEIRRTQTRRVLATGAETVDVRKVLGGLAVGRSDAVFSYTDGGGVPLTAAADGSFAHGDARTITIKVLMRREHSDKLQELSQLVSIRNLES